MSTPATLVYSAITSIDGYTTDAAGSIEWSEPDAEVLTFINDLERGIGTYLYGRGMYESMTYWEEFEVTGDALPCVRDFTAIWLAADKVVYSTTLEEVRTARTRLERSFDPGAVRRMKGTAGHDLSVGGAGLAAQAMAAGLVDEVHLFLVPVTVGGGTPALPAHAQRRFELRGVDRFASGFVHLHYGIGH